MSMALSVPIFNNFQKKNDLRAKLSNFEKKNYVILYKMIFFKFQCLKVCHEAPLFWKLLNIGTLRAKDIRTPVIRLVLLHTDYRAYRTKTLKSEK